MFAQNIPPEVTGNRLSSGLRYSPLCFHFFTSFPSHFAPSRFSGRPIHYTLYSLAMFMAEIVHGHRCRSWPVPFKFLYRIPNTCVTYRGKKPDCYITQGRLVTGTKSYLALWRFVIWWCKYLTGVIFLLYVGEGCCGGRKQTFPGTGTRDGHTKKDGRKSARPVPVTTCTSNSQRIRKVYKMVRKDGVSSFQWRGKDTISVLGDQVKFVFISYTIYKNVSWR